METRTEAMAVVIMDPPVPPITRVLVGDFSSAGVMEDGGWSPEDRTEAQSHGDGLWSTLTRHTVSQSH